jgi:hypothetical protein
MISKKQRKQSRFRNTHPVSHYSKVYTRDPGGQDYSVAATSGLFAGLFRKFRRKADRT